MTAAHSPAHSAITDAPPREVEWRKLVPAYERLMQRRDAPAAVGIEAALEALYREACEHGLARIRELDATLGSPPVSPVALAWQKLLQLVMAYESDALAELDAALAQAPARSAWLIAAEAARLTYQARGPQAAWERMAAIEPVPAAEPWLDEGPLVVHALLLKLRLAAASGHWDVHDRLVEPSCARFGPPDDPRVLRIRLAAADHDVMRGDYARAADALDQVEPHCRGDLRLALLAIRLHALVACAAQRRDTQLRVAIEHTLGELAQASSEPAPESTGERYRLPALERADLVRRVEQLVDHAGADAREIEPEQVSSLASALAVERRARREQSTRPPLEILASLLPRVEALLLREDATEHHESWIRLRLLWCRLVVDVGDVDRYEDCELALTQIIDETTRAGLVPLAMSAHDQRAVLYAQEPLRAWDMALADAGQAGNLAVTLLARNASTGTSERIMERALLGTLLPVLDRVIDLLLDSALAVEPDGSSARAGWDRERLERWLRFGRAVHDYVEQSQVLALKEARHAYGAGDMPTPHRFALVAPGQALESPLPRLRRALRPRDAVIQYFVTGRFVVIFLYARDRFDWVVMDAAAEVQQSGVKLEAPTAHAALLHLVAQCHAWLTGESTPEHEASAEPLRRLLLPEVITAHLQRSRARHVRIIPHDVLYRVPLGRLQWSGRKLLERVSLSFHPTAGLAVESAAHVLRPRRRKLLGYLSGPDLPGIEREHAGIRTGLGRTRSLAHLVAIDSSRAQSTAEVVERIAGLDVLHVACHGVRPFQRREAYMKLGTGNWKLSEIASLRMHHCALAILQACWTGWMEHERTNPVQGFPQAFCDAGVGAVIAPLVAVPDSLTPVFAEVLYRTLRFLPAERALRRTLDILREHGAELVAGNAQASRDWNDLGPLDVVEYRYVGQTSLNLGGNRAARVMGWLSCWRWLRQLRRQRRHRAAAALPARSDP
jgi:CHAT domain-containing protein